MDRIPRGFLRKFFLLCSRTNLEESYQQELRKYEHHPFANRVKKWAQLRFKDTEDDERE